MDVITKTYVKPGQEEIDRAAAYLDQEIDASQLQRNCNDGTLEEVEAEETLAMTGTLGTGAGGFEPPTSRLTAGRSAS